MRKLALLSILITTLFAGNLLADITIFTSDNSSFNSQSILVANDGSASKSSFIDFAAGEQNYTTTSGSSSSIFNSKTELTDQYLHLNHTIEQNPTYNVNSYTQYSSRIYFSIDQELNYSLNGTFNLNCSSTNEYANVELKLSKLSYPRDTVFNELDYSYTSTEFIIGDSIHKGKQVGSSTGTLAAGIYDLYLSYQIRDRSASTLEGCSSNGFFDFKLGNVPAPAAVPAPSAILLSSLSLTLIRKVRRQ